MAKTTDERKTECRVALLELLKPGDTVHTVIRSVSRSNMSRRLDCFVIHDNQLRFITSYVADLLEYSYSTDDWRKAAGLLVHGCGMDMGFEVVYNLGHALFPDGFIVKGIGPHGHEIPARPNTAANRASLKKAIAKGYTFRGRNGDESGIDRCGGYALRQEWI